MRNSSVTQQFLITIFIILITAQCGLFESGDAPVQPKEPVELQAVILLSAGNVTADNKPVKTGTVLNSGQTVKTGPNSLCDLQIRGTKSGAIVRLKANSEFSLTGRKSETKTDIISELKKGKGLFDVAKLPKDENLMIATPTAIAAVRGTRFEVAITGEQTEIELHEGAVAARPRVPGLENLPPDIQERSRVIQETIRDLEEKETVLEPGKKLRITGVTLPDSVRETIEKIPADGADNPEKARQIAEKLDEDLSDHKETINKQINSYQSEAPAGIPEGELKEKLQEYDELIRIENTKLEAENVSEAVNERNKQNNAKLMRRIEKIFNKPSETLILSNGARVSGVVIQIGSVYYVHTVNGRLAYPESSVEGIEF